MTEGLVMVVDDDFDLQAILQTTLEASGYSCIGASSVKEALQKLKTNRPALVILDWKLPKENGSAFLEQSSSWLPDGATPPPIIVVSGFDDPIITNYTLKHGAVSFIKKPYDPQYLLGMVATFIEPSTTETPRSY